MILACSLTSSLAFAQPNNPYGNQGVQKVEIDGKLQGWQGGRMQILNSANQAILFSLPQNPNAIHFSCPVEKAALKKGMMVRIQAAVAPNGQFLDPLASLIVFTPDPAKANAQSSLNDRSVNVPGVYRMSDIYRPKPGESASPDVRIVGAIIGLEQNILGLLCGNVPMKVELSESPRIELNTSSLGYAKPGDTVKVNAVMNVAANEMVATSVTITGSKAIMADAPPPTVQPTTKLRLKEKPKAKSKKLVPTEKPEMSEKPESTEKPTEPPPSEEKPEPK